MDADLLNRPLFVEPTAEMEREDAWSGPPGFMLGGMASPTREVLAEQFFDAAGILVAAVLAAEIEDYRLVNPALFLYRHALELQLKAAIGGVWNGHDLGALTDDLDRMVQSRRGHPVPAWMTSRLRELASMDPGSTAFRYGENRGPKAGERVPVEGEVHVDVRHLETVMGALRSTIADLASNPP